MSYNLSLDLKSKIDTHGRTYYVAKLKGPFSIDCLDGIAILVFVSEEGAEQIQIAPMDQREKSDQ